MQYRGTKRVADVVDYERHIKGKRVVRLYAGVGAGKNYWANELYKQGLRVLMITSRANTAAAQCKKYGADRTVDVWRLSNISPFDDEHWNQYSTETTDEQRFVICTNAHIESFIKNRYKKDDPKTHIWNHFDVIILDEAHSITTDATFSESQFYIDSFLNRAFRDNPDCDIVLMSGTLAPVEWFGAKTKKVEVTTINCFEKCIHHEPEYVVLYPYKSAIHRVNALWKANRRVVYFANTIERILEMLKKLVALGVPESDIGISFSKEEKYGLFTEKQIAAKEELEKHLISKEEIPSQIKIFLTTSKNKEGISIENQDISVVFSESHVCSDLKQMAGRIRHDIDKLYILYDAPQLPSKSTYMGEELSIRCLNAVRSAAKNTLLAHQNVDREICLQKIITEVESTFSSIRYDYLKEDFRHYRGRIHGERIRRADLKEFEDAVHYFHEPVNQYGYFGYDILLRWFPYSKILKWDDRAELKDDVRNIFKRYLKDNNWLNVTITNTDRAVITEEVRRLVQDFGGKELNIRPEFIKLGPALKQLGFRIDETASHDTNHFIITEIGE